VRSYFEALARMAAAPSMIPTRVSSIRVSSTTPRLGVRSSTVEARLAAEMGEGG